MNRGLPVLEPGRGLDTRRRPEGSWTLGTKMRPLGKNIGLIDTEHVKFTSAADFKWLLFKLLSYLDERKIKVSSIHIP